MDDTYLLMLSGTLIGAGLCAVFFRKNLIAILMSLFSICYGAVLIFIVFSSGSEKVNEVFFFLLCMSTLVLGIFTLGLAQAYKRYKAVGTAELDEKNELRS
jgi:NADH:ubiquinone oxidoreductase subunit K